MLEIWRRQLHVSWLISFFSFSVIGGIALSAFFNRPWSGGAGPVAGLVITLLIISKNSTRAGVVIIVVISGLMLGLYRGGSGRTESAEYEKFIGSTILLQGTISDDTVAKGGSTGIKLRSIKINSSELDGQVWASTSTNLELKRNDRIELSGKLRPGFGSYSASVSFARLISANREPGGDPARTVRDAFDGGMEKTVPQPEAALAIGYLTGQHNLVPDTFIKQMQITGLIHLVITGGYNVTILVRLARRTGARVSKRLAVFMGSFVLFGLTVVSGFVAPMARTTVVTSLSLAAWFYGRWPHPLVLIPAAAAITALIDPSFVWGDVGWYMTFIAYAGLILLGPMLKVWWWGAGSHGEVKQIIVDTIAVQIVTTPLMAFAFQQYSLYGLPANLLVLPLMSFTMLSSAAAGIAGMSLPHGLAYWVSLPANELLKYTYKITIWMANAPGADAGSGISFRGLAVSYLIIFLFVWRLKQKTKYNFRSENFVE